MSFIVHKPLPVILFTFLGSIPRNRIIGSKGIDRSVGEAGGVRGLLPASQQAEAGRDMLLPSGHFTVKTPQRVWEGAVG